MQVFHYDFITVLVFFTDDNSFDLLSMSNYLMGNSLQNFIFHEFLFCHRYRVHLKRFQWRTEQKYSWNHFTSLEPFTLIPSIFVCLIFRKLFCKLPLESKLFWGKTIHCECIYRRMLLMICATIILLLRVFCNRSFTSVTNSMPNKFHGRKLFRKDVVNR